MRQSKCFLGHDVIKIFSGYLSAVGGCSLEHFLEFLDVHGLSQLFGNSADVIRVDCSSVVVIKKVENFIDAVLNNKYFTLDYLSPSFEVIPSMNSSKSTSLPKLSRSEIILKMVGFLDSNPRLCIADLSYRGSIFPVASVSNRLKAYLSSSTSS